MSEDVQYWLVAQGGLTPETRPEYLERGQWVSANPARHAQHLAAMRPGDRIALKSTSRRTSGVPFFNADQVVSVMKVHATGTVLGVEPVTGTVKVDWTAENPSREWYLYTYIVALAQLTPEKDVQTNLIDWLFHGGQQDLSLILDWWDDRYPPQPGFTWIPWHKEFAQALLQYRDDRGPLVAAVLDVARDEPLLKQLLADSYAEDGTGPVRDLDPFTLFATFNRNLTTENRQHLIARLGQRFSIDAPTPQDFDGLPVASTLRSWFVRYERRRRPGDIDALWRAFAAAMALASEDTPAARAEFIGAFDTAQQVSGVHWNLTMGLYWIQPDAFPTLDSRSREFNQQRFGIGASVDGAGYLAVRDQLLERFGDGDTSITGFPLLSYAAWTHTTALWPKHTIKGMASWGARIAESADLEAIEHDDKRLTAELLRRVKDQIGGGDASWLATFKQGIDSTGTIHYIFKSQLKQAAQSNPRAFAAVLQGFWSDPRPASLNALHQGLTDCVGKVSPGNATALGAWLLMAVDVEGNAPYSPSRVEHWHRLTGGEPLDWTASPSDRYSDMLALLERLAGSLEPLLGSKPSVLETQGIAWATSENEIPALMSDEERRALEAWRSGTGEPARAWLIRAKKGAAADWLEEGYVALAATNLPEVAPGAEEKTVVAAVESGYQHVDYAQRKALAGEYHAFLTRMKPDDIVAVLQRETLHVGRVTGEAQYVDDAGDRLRRPVRWIVAVDAERVGEPRGLLDEQGTLIDATQHYDLLEALLHNPEPPLPPRVSGLASATPDLAAQLHMPLEQLQEVVDLLQSRQQIVLYGPPGTGKTYLALALARHIVGAGNGSRVQLVQFHPSYAYEDFFEGFRPVETAEGQATFELTAGPLRRIASAAAANPGEPFVLVIDELNRANLAKVFGELYFLLEYRGEAINLQYNPEDHFRLPENLYFIGTMNTADRSIALLDAAMRRRFSFIELHPDEPPVRDMLAAWLKAQGHHDERAQLLAALNAAIDDQDRDLRIGPSYLMRAEAANADGLALVWKHDIMPLLEEHYYGRLTRVEIHRKFGLEALRRDLAGSDEDSAEDAGE